MSADLLAFLAQYLGVPNVGTTPDNRGQCVGLVELWMQANGQPGVWGNAKDLLANAPQPPYRVVTNGPLNYPPAGAIVVWGTTWGAGFGHTAVAVAAAPMYLAVFEQNNPDGSPPVVSTRGYDGVLGWLLLPA